MAAKKLLQLFHPDSPGTKVWVMRGWWGQRFYPRHFATLPECETYRELTRYLDHWRTCYCRTKGAGNPDGMVIK